MFWCMRLNCTFSLSKATCPQCGAKSQHTHMGVHDLRCTKTYSETCTHSHTLCSPSCNKWGPDCVWWWWWWCKRPGMLVSMDDKLCWVNVECVLVCDYVACVWLCGKSVSVCVNVWVQRGQTVIHVQWAIKQPYLIPFRIHCLLLQPITNSRVGVREYVSFFLLSLYLLCLCACICLHVKKPKT